MNATKDPSPSTPRVLTLDVGTSSARCALFDAEGVRDEASSTQRKYVPRLTVDGGAELEPQSLVATIAGLIDETLSRAGSEGSALACVASATFWHSLVGVDARGKALTPVYLWMDARSHRSADALKSLLNERKVHARTGCVLHWSYLPAKLLWLQSEKPELFDSVARWQSFGAYLIEQLFGVSTTSISLASASGLFDQHRCDWDEELLEVSGISRARVPEIAEDGRLLRGLLSPWKERWPALARVPWLLPLGDGALSNVGAGCVSPRRAALMVGTSVALRVLFATDELAIPWGVFGYRLDRSRVCLGGALNDGGSLLDWMRRTLVLPDRTELEQRMAAMTPDTHGLTLLPLFGGERSPGWASRVRGAITGMSLATTPLELYRAALEGIAVRCAELDSLLREAVPGLERTIATGGALMHSPAWLSIMADALGRPITVSTEREATSRGAALYALERLGLLPGGLDSLPAPVGSSFEPDVQRHSIYLGVLERQRALYREATRETGGGS